MSPDVTKYYVFQHFRIWEVEPWTISDMVNVAILHFIYFITHFTKFIPHNVVMCVVIGITFSKQLTVVMCFDSKQNTRKIIIIMKQTDYITMHNKFDSNFQRSHSSKFLTRNQI
jgi:hypothetical protein